MGLSKKQQNRQFDLIEKILDENENVVPEEFGVLLNIATTPIDSWFSKNERAKANRKKAWAIKKIKSFEDGEEVLRLEKKLLGIL